MNVLDLIKKINELIANRNLEEINKHFDAIKEMAENLMTKRRNLFLVHALEKLELTKDELEREQKGGGGGGGGGHLEESLSQLSIGSPNAVGRSQGSSTQVPLLEVVPRAPGQQLQMMDELIDSLSISQDIPKIEENFTRIEKILEALRPTSSSSRLFRQAELKLAKLGKHLKNLKEKGQRPVQKYAGLYKLGNRIPEMYKYESGMYRYICHILDLVALTFRERGHVVEAKNEPTGTSYATGPDDIGRFCDYFIGGHRDSWIVKTLGKEGTHDYHIHLGLQLPADLPQGSGREELPARYSHLIVATAKCAGKSPRQWKYTFEGTEGVPDDQKLFSQTLFKATHGGNDATANIVNRIVANIRTLMQKAYGNPFFMNGNYRVNDIPCTRVQGGGGGGGGGGFGRDRGRGGGGGGGGGGFGRDRGRDRGGFGRDRRS